MKVPCFLSFEFTNWRTTDNDNNDDNDEVDDDDGDDGGDDDNDGDDGDSMKPTVQDFDTDETRARLIRGVLRVTASKLIRTLINIGVLIRSSRIILRCLQERTVFLSLKLQYRVSFNIIYNLNI